MSVKNGNTVQSDFRKMEEYGIHLAESLKKSISCGFGNICANLYLYLLDQLMKVHTLDKTEPQEQVIPHSYNPEMVLHIILHHMEVKFSNNQHSVLSNSAI